MDLTAPGEVVILDTPQLLPHISHVLTHFLVEHHSPDVWALMEEGGPESSQWELGLWAGRSPAFSRDQRQNKPESCWTLGRWQTQYISTIRYHQIPSGITTHSSVFRMRSVSGNGNRGMTPCTIPGRSEPESLRQDSPNDLHLDANYSSLP